MLRYLSMNGASHEAGTVYDGQTPLCTLCGGNETYFLTSESAVSQEVGMLFSVIPAEAGIQSLQVVTGPLDSGFHRSDDFLQNYQN
jgi:hypothetical protein